MKNVRNWAAHKNIFENLTEKEVAFLFLINMRSMFQLNAILPFEKALLSLFDNPLSYVKSHFGKAIEFGKVLFVSEKKGKK